MNYHSHSVPNSRSFALREGLLAISDAIRSMPTLLATWQHRARQRSHLARLDQRLLRDIGLSHKQVQDEVAKPFWRA